MSLDIGRDLSREFGILGNVWLPQSSTAPASHPLVLHTEAGEPLLDEGEQWLEKEA